MNGIDQAREWIAQADAIAVLTGAGISAESGVPTFRGAGGLWRNFRAEDIATPEAFSDNPKLVWEWYRWRRGLIAGCEPNAGHLALVRLEKMAPCFTLITQNVDGLHERAGSKRVLKIHGDIWIDRCPACMYERANRALFHEDLPECPECGRMMRPGVVWFGECLPPSVWEDAERAVHACHLLLVVGTSAQVYPAAGLIPRARAAGTRVIEVNIESTPVTGSVDLALEGPAAGILPLIVGI